MNRLTIIKNNYWYKVGEQYIIEAFDPKLGFQVNVIGSEDKFYVATSDCWVSGETPGIIENVELHKEEELIIKLIPNSEGKCVDFPVKLEQGDWIDLRACPDYKWISYSRGDKFYVSLGVAIKLPVGYEAYIVVRSSLGKKHDIILMNGKGIVDNVYNGNSDCWGAWFYATEDGSIDFNERICQFRIQKNQPTLKLTQVDNLEGVNRGGFGEGTKNEK